MGKNKFFNPDLTIEQVISKLVELGYICLCDSDFGRMENTQNRMEKMRVRCLYSHRKKCWDCEVYSLFAWDPSDKRFVEMEFLMSGEILIEKSKITIGKNMYSGEKAIELINKFIFIQ